MAFVLRVGICRQNEEYHWMNRKVLLSLAVCAALIAGCASQAKKDVSSAEKTSDSGSEFTRQLHNEYTEFAERELIGGHRKSANHFAQKASSAASGTKVAPDELPAKLNWDEAALREARPRLMSALNSPQAAKRADLAAKAQVNFDCWAEQASEIWYQPEDRKFCQTKFETALAELSGVSVAVAAPPAAPAAEQFLVFFEFDSSKLTPDAVEILKNVASAATSRSDANLTLVGYTDLAGSPEYNMALSGRRADSVKAELENLGRSSGAMTTEAKGKADPMVLTADGVPEAQNRRVQILLR